MKKCPSFDAEIQDETKPCPTCGNNADTSGEIIGNAKEIDSQIIEEKHNPVAVDVQYKVLPTLVKILLVAATFIFSPIIGFNCGILLWGSEKPAYRRFGKILILIALAYFCIALGMGIPVKTALHDGLGIF